MREWRRAPGRLVMREAGSPRASGVADPLSSSPNPPRCSCTHAVAMRGNADCLRPLAARFWVHPPREEPSDGWNPTAALTGSTA